MFVITGNSQTDMISMILMAVVVLFLLQRMMFAGKSGGSVELKSLAQDVHKLKHTRAELQPELQALIDGREQEHKAYTQAALPIKLDIQHVDEAIAELTKNQQHSEELKKEGKDDEKIREAEVSMRLDFTKNEGEKLTKTVKSMDDNIASASDREAVLSFANTDVDFDDAPAHKKVFGILEKMHKKLEKTLSPIDSKEEKAAAKFEETREAKDEEIREISAQIEADSRKIDELKQKMSPEELKQWKIDEQHAELSAAELHQHEKGERLRKRREAEKEKKAH